MLPLKTLQTATVASGHITLSLDSALGVAATPLTAAVGVVVPGTGHAPLTSGADRLGRADTPACVWVTDMPRLVTRSALLATTVGDAPEPSEACIALRSSHPWFARTLARHIITVVVLCSHGIADASLAALARSYTPSTKGTLVTSPALDPGAAGTGARRALALLTDRALGMTATRLAAAGGKPKVKRTALVACETCDPWPAGTLPCIRVAEVSFGTHKVTTALPASGTDGTKPIFALAARPACILVLTKTLAGVSVALLTL